MPLLRCKATGIYDQATIIVTGDHGPHPLADMLSRLPGEISGIAPWVPVIIRGPGVEPQVSSVDYQHIDFKPTLLDILGLPPEEDLAGVSAFAPQRPGRDKMFFISLYLQDTLARWVYKPDTGQWLLVE